ncbi:hypothetical protein VP01_821g2 [Puccinia sorghi]|uniref:Uncharacterized protein n=1 Tax=Puccinia sorghi TaxID=27349 RepID=A0A0L6UAS5_9BASI|nr:hypothetical protein VP01_821g2 [Puccinia sorghi]
MHSDCAECTVTVPKHLHIQTGGVWMRACLEHAACQLQAVQPVFVAVLTPILGICTSSQPNKISENTFLCFLNHLSLPSTHCHKHLRVTPQLLDSQAVKCMKNTLPWLPSSPRWQTLSLPLHIFPSFEYCPQNFSASSNPQPLPCSCCQYLPPSLLLLLIMQLMHATPPTLHPVNSTAPAEITSAPVPKSALAVRILLWFQTTRPSWRLQHSLSSTKLALLHQQKSLSSSDQGTIQICHRLGDGTPHQDQSMITRSMITRLQVIIDWSWCLVWASHPSVNIGKAPNPTRFLPLPTYCAPSTTSTQSFSSLSACTDTVTSGSVATCSIAACSTFHSTQNFSPLPPTCAFLLHPNPFHPSAHHTFVLLHVYPLPCQLLLPPPHPLLLHHYLTTPP